MRTPEGAQTSFTASDAYRFAGQTLLMLTPQSRPRTKYLVPTDNIIVPERYFNLMNKCNLIGWLKYDLIRFFS